MEFLILFIKATLTPPDIDREMTCLPKDKIYS
jgi:hypothetical protein